MEFLHHSVILLVGPSMAGKSTWATAFKKKVEEQGQRCVVLSSDDYRRQLLGADLPRHAPQMLEVSEHAFSLMFAGLRAHTSLPVNTDFVVIDSTGFQEKFRDEVVQIAENNGYNVGLIVFDYKTAAEHLAGCGTEYERHVVQAHVTRFRKDVLPGLKRKKYAFVHKVGSMDTARWEAMDVTLPDLPLKSKCELTTDSPIAVIGDIHECTASLAKLTATLPENAQLVVLGDWMDKGGDTAGVIAAMEQLVGAGAILLMGNHERYLHGRLTNTISPAPEDVEKGFFTALSVLNQDPALAERFLALAGAALPYLKVQGNRRTIFVTHAPAPHWAIGKLSGRCLKAQANVRMKDHTLEAEIEFMREKRGESSGNQPWHVFGHIAHADRVISGNQVWLDTGAVHGGKLSAAVFTTGGRRELDIVQADGQPVATKQLAKLPQESKPLPDLTPDEEETLNRVVSDNIRFISGTMSPAPSANGKLEPLHAGLSYFRKAGVDKVVLQPKYMGSRCQVYLTRGKPEESYAVTRNGNRIHWVPDLQAALAKVQAHVEGLGEWQAMILDGELMPWFAIGDGLINRGFIRYSKAVSAELNVLAEDPVFLGFQEGAALRLPERMAGLAVFNRQMDLYGKDGKLEYKPFTILAIDGNDVTDRDQAEVFASLSEDVTCLVDLNNPEDWEKAESFFNALTTTAGKEGVVIKPLTPVEGVAPYMKVRNEDYLHIIYGYDYKLKYDRLVREKRTDGKLRLSIREWRMGRAMLNADDSERRNLAARLLLDIREESGLDPRL